LVNTVKHQTGPRPDFRHCIFAFFYAYTQSMSFGFPMIERRQFVVTCKCMEELEQSGSA
jgi:hypothetical protein